MLVKTTELVNKVVGSCGLAIFDVSYDHSVDVGIFFPRDYVKNIP